MNSNSDGTIVDRARSAERTAKEINKLLKYKYPKLEDAAEELGIHPGTLGNVLSSSKRLSEVAQLVKDVSVKLE